MLLATVPLAWRSVIVFVAGVAGGVANGLAGGGTFITFPTLLALGVPALSANLTTTVGIVPSFFSGVRLARTDTVDQSRTVAALVPSVVVGTLIGCALLLSGSPTTFENVVPYLVGGATILFAAAPRITRAVARWKHAHHVRRLGLHLGIGVVAVYGGYFGAGVGIMLLAVTTLSLPLAIHQLQGLRNVLSIVMTAVASLVFLVHGHLALSELWPLLGGTLLGGWLGTRLVTRLPARGVRALVIAIGTLTTLKLLWPA